jgi:hypothetical protein
VVAQYEGLVIPEIVDREGMRYEFLLALAHVVKI